MADQTITDPLGRTITLHDHTWYGHVLLKHGEMRGRRREAEQAIEQPRTINFSSYDPSARLYHGPVAADDMMVVVVAHVTSGFVMTAYRAKRVKGAVEWP